MPGQPCRAVTRHARRPFRLHATLRCPRYLPEATFPRREGNALAATPSGITPQSSVPFGGSALREDRYRWPAKAIPPQYRSKSEVTVGKSVRISVRCSPRTTSAWRTSRPAAPSSLNARWAIRSGGIADSSPRGGAESGRYGRISAIDPSAILSSRPSTYVDSSNDPLHPENPKRRNHPSSTGVSAFMSIRRLVGRT